MPLVEAKAVQRALSLKLNFIFFRVPFYAKKIIRLAKLEKKLPVLEEDIPQGATARGEFALTLLPYLLPPPIHKEGRRSIHTTVHESLRLFIDINPVGTNMVEYLERVRSKAHPFVLLLGDAMLVSQAFAVILGKAIECETALAAVDTCFKAYYVFDTKYPDQCKPTWEFFQRVVFDFEGTVTPSVNFLKTQILACR